MLSRYLICASLLAAVTGCETNPPVVKQDGPSPLDLEILRVSEVVERAANRMSTGSTKVAFTASTNAPRIAVDMNFVGPIEAVLRTLALTANYEFVAIGAPKAAIVVSASGRQRPWIELVHAVALQLGSRGEIVVNDELKRVEIRYAG